MRSTPKRSKITTSGSFTFIKKLGSCPTKTTCSSELVVSARSTAFRVANSVSSEPSIASRIVLGKMAIFCTSWLIVFSTSLAANVDDGSSFQVRLGLSQDLVGDRSGISLPEEDVAEHVRKRVALRPAQVAVGGLAGFVTQVQEKCGDGVGHYRALPPQYSVYPHVHASQLQYLLLELRGVFHVDLQKQDRHVLRDVVVLSLLL